MKIQILTLVLGFILISCSHNQPAKKTPGDKGAGDVDDAVLGTWVQKDIQCADNDPTTEGTEAATALRIGMSVGKIVVTSDKSFWDVKEYRDVESPNDFCQISTEERWTTPKAGELTIADTDVLVSGNGQVACEKKFRWKNSRHFKYEVSEKELVLRLPAKAFLISDKDSEKSYCKKSETIVRFQRDAADE